MDTENENYRDGWYSAEGDYQDLIPYDTNIWPGHVEGVAAEHWMQGYYDFWKSKDFKL